MAHQIADYSRQRTALISRKSQLELDVSALDTARFV
jgi:hypothetical protein